MQKYVTNGYAPSVTYRVLFGQWPGHSFILLADVHQQLRGEWTFDDKLTRFVDIFFDNLFTDMAVQRRIEQARNNACLLHDHVKEALRNVVRQHETALVEQARRTQELRTYLERAT